MDRKEFEAWLIAQPNEVAVLVAMRAAARAFAIPTHFLGERAKGKTLALLTARAILTSGVAAKMPTPDVGAAAYAAAYAAADSAAGAAAGAAAYAAADSAAGAAADSAAYAAAYAAAFKDTEHPFETLFETAIWHAPGTPDWLNDALKGRDDLLRSGADWAFWRKWYDGLLTGAPIDWDLQCRVALIEEKVWEAGPDVVAAEIARIEADWLAEQLPQADSVEFNEDLARFRSLPVAMDPGGLVETQLKQVEFARSTLAKSNCGVNSSSTVWLYIDFTLEQCREDANAVEQNLEIARLDIADGLASGAYFEDPKLTALERVLDRAVTDLRAYHPEVAEAWATRAEFVVAQAKAEQQKLMVEAETQMIAISDEKLGKELQLDGETIRKGSGEARKTALRRFLGRVSQFRIGLRSSDVLKRIEDSISYRVSRIVHTLQSIIDFFTGGGA